MDNTTEHVSIHIPKYENEPIDFDTPTPDVSVEIADIQNYIREKAGKKLERCKQFEVSLPPSITGVTNKSSRIEFESLFQTPTLNDLEIVSTNQDGTPIRLNDTQLNSIKQTGKFDVDSIHFLGQHHRWKLSKLLQSGIQTANEVFFEELSWAVYMIIIFIRNRIESDHFSFKSTLKSWKKGFISLLDILIGLPAVVSKSIEKQVENERRKFLVNELSPHESEKAMHKVFCEQLPVLFKMMAENKHQIQPPQMLPYPHRFITPNNIDIDLRLYNHDLQRQIQPILSNLLSNNTSKNGFSTTKRRLINEYKHRQAELQLSKEQMAKRIQTDLNNEYTEHIFKSIENSDELEKVSPGIARLLVAQARAILTLNSTVELCNEQLETHLRNTRATLVRDHPIKSKISRWIETKISNERIKYIEQHQWDIHQITATQCHTLGNDQVAYFIQQDLIFRRDHEATVRENIKLVTEPMRTINCHRSIWFPRNWIVERTHPLPIERIPTYFADNTYTVTEEENRLALINSHPKAEYNLRKRIDYSVTTNYPFWRWRLFLNRQYCWLSNAIYLFCLVIPFASSVSFRALFSTKAFTPDYCFKKEDLKLHKNPNSKTETFISRLVAVWNNVRVSREKFEQIPDRGLLGKNIQRIFNQLWNYIGKGLVGTTVICVIYPASCLILSTVSFILGVLSPIWMPILTALYSLLPLLINDSDSAGKFGRRFFCLISIIIIDFVACGIIQPILVLISLLISPTISFLICVYALFRRCAYGIYDTILYHTIVKAFARIPTNDSFLARRISGPGLASEYFYQVSSPEVLAALESLIEQNQLKAYSAYVKRILMKPIAEYQRFFNIAFRPFSGSVQSGNQYLVYDQMNTFVNEHIRQLQALITKRDDLLRLRLDRNHNRIRLTENDLTTVLTEGAKLVEKWYPNQVLPYFEKNEIERFWNDHGLEPDDWFSLTSKLLQQIFSQEFLTPLEQTDTFYSLKVDHLTLTKYVQMINSANLHDDLDVVTTVYMPETSYTIQQPSFVRKILNPPEHWPDNVEIANLRLEDQTYLPCHFLIPIRLPEIIYINIIIYNRDTNNSITSLTNIPQEKVIQLVAYNHTFYKGPVLPPYSLGITTDALLIINNDDENNLVLN